MGWGAVNKFRSKEEAIAIIRAQMIVTCTRLVPVEVEASGKILDI